MLNRSGVYAITTPDGLQYIGATKHFGRRWIGHRKELKKGDHHSKPLLEAYSKYGLSNLKFEILLICSEDTLGMYEQRALDVLKPAYNTCLIVGSMKGYRHTTETRAKLSATSKGRIQSAEHRAKTSARHKGVKRSAEFCAKISAALTGRIFSESHKANLSAAKTGTKWSLEDRQKLSAIRKATWASPESEERRQKLIARNKARSAKEKP